MSFHLSDYSREINFYKYLFEQRFYYANYYERPKLFLFSQEKKNINANSLNKTRLIYKDRWK